ncbi:MAG: Rieske 2Fe-2S domain-containing protein [Vicingaceae bacterium]
MSNLKWFKVYDSIQAAKEVHQAATITKHFIANRPICMVHSEGVFYAFEDSCPHQGKSFVGGSCHNGVVECPVHKYKFVLKPDNGRMALNLFPTKEDEEGVYVGIKMGFWD